MGKKKKSTDAAEILAEMVIKGLQEKKAKDIVLLDLGKVTHAVTRYFVIATGDSSTQVAALADSVYDEVKKKLGETPWHKEGNANAEWILLDYVSVVAHIFLPETRSFYNLEKLWADAEIKIIK